jgi:hypothetical protein
MDVRGETAAMRSLQRPPRIWRARCAVIGSGSAEVSFESRLLISQALAAVMGAWRARAAAREIRVLSRTVKSAFVHAREQDAPEEEAPRAYGRAGGGFVRFLRAPAPGDCAQAPEGAAARSAAISSVGSPRCAWPPVGKRTRNIFKRGRR